MKPVTIIREYQPTDAETLRELFYNTIHIVNLRDYTPAQVDAWAPREFDRQRWADSLLAKMTFVAVREETLVGFGELESTGHIDRFYCHAECQGQGVGSMLLGQLESKAHMLALPQLFTEASITARPFFERRGFITVREQEVECRGVSMTNFVMTKQLGAGWGANEFGSL